MIPPGATAGAPGVHGSEGPTPVALRRRLDGPRRRLLFVGTTFRVKAGDTVVAALDQLRREVSELQERMDFTERILLQNQERPQVAKGGEA